jgi:DNA-binding protein H-NS
MDSYQSLLDKISVLEKKASSLRDNEKKRVIAKIREQIELYDVQPDELFSDTKTSVIGKPAISKPIGKSISKSVSTRGKRVLPPKYRDLATGKTWNGHGKRPFWLVGDRDAYLIAAQPAQAEAAAVPKKRGRKKKEAPTADWKSSAVATVAVPTKTETKPKKRAKRKTSRKANSPKTDTGSTTPSVT